MFRQAEEERASEGYGEAKTDQMHLEILIKQKKGVLST